MSKRTNAEGSPPPARGGQSLRLRDHVRLASELLEKKQLEYAEAMAAREVLDRRIVMLEDVLDDASAASLLQRMAVKALGVPRRPGRLFLEGLEPTMPVLTVDALPVSLHGWDDTLLERVACMSFGDALSTYRSFLSVAQPMALQAMCHGESSPTYKELCTVTRQYANFMMLHCLVATPQLELYRSTNLETGERDCVPAGWYARIAQQLPPHVELARMAAVALSMAQNVNRGGLSSLQEQVAGIMRSDAQKDDLTRLGELLEDYASKDRSPALQRNRIIVYLLMSMLNMQGLPLHTVSVVMSSCWPFCIAGGQILLSYLGRPDVAVLIADPSDSTDLRGREARQGGTATKYEQ